MRPTRKQSKGARGFTLVELIVSMGLFTIVIFGTTSAMLTMLDANRKAQAMRTAMESLGFALDDIARSVRVGGNYECLGANGAAITIPVSSSAPVFTAGAACTGFKIQTDAGVVVYYREGSGIKKSFFPTSGTGYSGLAMTPPELIITTAIFDVLGDQTSQQPRMLIGLKGTAGDKIGFQSNFHIQTVVAARLPNAQITP